MAEEMWSYIMTEDIDSPFKLKEISTHETLIKIYGKL